MRAEVLPVLAKSLAPLKPTEQELGAVLAELKQLGHQMARRLRLPDLQQALRPAASSPPQPA